MAPRHPFHPTRSKIWPSTAAPARPPEKYEARDLSRDLLNPNRPWLRRMADGGRIGASMMTGVLTGGLIGAKNAADAVRGAILSELESKGDKQEAVKRNGLYYLLKAKKKG